MDSTKLALALEALGGILCILGGIFLGRTYGRWAMMMTSDTKRSWRIAAIVMGVLGIVMIAGGAFLSYKGQGTGPGP